MTFDVVLHTQFQSDEFQPRISPISYGPNNSRVYCLRLNDHLNLFLTDKTAQHLINTIEAGMRTQEGVAA